MSAEVTRRHVVFPPADECALGPVRVFGPDGELVRTIPVKALLARPVPDLHEAPKLHRREDERPPVKPRRRTKSRDV